MLEGTKSLEVKKPDPNSIKQWYKSEITTLGFDGRSNRGGEVLKTQRGKSRGSGNPKKTAKWLIEEGVSGGYGNEQELRFEKNGGREEKNRNFGMGGIVT